MTDDGIIISPRVGKMKQQCNLLRDEISVLLAEYDHLVDTVGPNIMAHYATTIGVKEYETLNLDVEVRRLKATIEMIQAIANQGKKPNLEQIEAAVEDELQSWKEKVDQMLSEITAGKDRLNNQMTTEESAELQKLYRMLAKKLHPDLNPDLTEKHKSLWARVQQAYGSGNLKEMRALALMVDDLPEEIDLPNQVELLEKRIADLKLQVENLVHKIAGIKSTPPHSLIEKLSDPEWVQEQISVCQGRIASLSAERENLENWLSIWRRQQ